VFVLSVSPTFTVEPNRVIEINKLGKFYVMGKPTFSVLKIHDPLSPDGSRDGFIIIDEELSYSSNPYELNKLFKMLDKGQLIPALFKSEEMAEEVCYACNRIRV
jgi:hypothetical protein